ncbi:MAG: ARMT1-like domain-containing protein, partial [Hydrogenimonas sp.]|nr:ARMT1-like domain-containing protein [Hydrogenimonas sp.]
LKASVAGNVIDLASTHTFDLDDEVAKVFDTPFAIDDSKELESSLEDASTLLVIGDNAGEHLFDKLMMEQIVDLYPRVEIFYAVRGRPIINDITLKEAKEAGIDEVATIVDSGVDTPGFDPERISAEARKVYESADMVISKGMGNYESLNDLATKEIFYLMKVKCSVVASSLGSRIGDIICYKGDLDV